MKLRITLVSVVLLLSGCGNTEATVETQKASADNDLMSVNAPSKILSASDIDLQTPYLFAYNDSVIDGYDTYKNSNPIMLEVDDDTTLNIYATNEVIDDTSYQLIETFSAKAGDKFEINSTFKYYKIESENDITATLTVI